VAAVGGERVREAFQELVHHLHARLREDQARGGRLSYLVAAGDSGVGREAAPFPETASRKTPPRDRTVPVRAAGETLEAIRQALGDCQRCPLGAKRRRLVFGEGDPHAELVFIGEAPGADEDLQGRPFVGRAGQLLTKIIEAMGLKRDDVYICNILKCRPPGNRNPAPDEVAACEPFLIRQLQAIRPRFICALGSVAARTLLKTEAPITVLRGRFQSYQGIRLMPTYHPAYLLRNPVAKKKVWEDVQIIMKALDLPIPERKNGLPGRGAPAGDAEGI
jgi:DNA polymerase